jgi:bacterial leucyl aminopeptidase
VSGTVTLQAQASDSGGIAVVEFYRGTTLLGSDTTAPYTYSWQTASEPNGAVSLSVKARDSSGNGATSSAVTVTVSNGGIASYESYYKVPRCAYTGSSCDSGTLLLGRGTLGPETNRPNTLYGSCTDGTSGTFHQDESIDQLRISSVEGGPITMGKTIRIEATVWASSSQYYWDRLELYFERYPNSTGRSWTTIATLSASGPGQQTLSTTYTLPTTSSAADVDLVIRAQFSPTPTSEGTCGSNGYRDVDDLAFLARPK